MVSRREFLADSARAIPAVGGILAAPLPLLTAATSRDELLSTAPRARHWTSLALAGGDCGECHEPVPRGRPGREVHAPGLVRCLLCAQSCTLRPGERGRCRARLNVKGELRSLVYGRPAAVNVDPIEKKPFYHFLPGSAAFSLGTAGCPLRCRFCQNWQLSQAAPEDMDARFVAPADLVAAAKVRAPVIAFTYNEPTVEFEYVLDVARAARDSGLRSVLVSCGFMKPAPLDELCEALAAIKIDLKGFDEAFYRDVCGAALKPVLASIARIRRRGVHLELVNLVVPTLNDSEAMLRGLVEWALGELGTDVPLHFTRFHPDFQIRNLAPTPIATLERARDMALGLGLRYVYVGNVPGHAGNHTLCPGCGRELIRRSGFLVVENRLAAGRCPGCGQKIAGVWA
jgi:pyruvate formate lyase activating enzyme